MLRAQVAVVIVFALPCLAEVVRGGLQAIPDGRRRRRPDGTPHRPATLLVVLPQAIRITIPSIVNTFIAFKDTSLIAIIGLTDLLGAAKAVLVDPKWIGFGPRFTSSWPGLRLQLRGLPLQPASGAGACRLQAAR